eukprot:CAMPEP_0183530092 /NCGR_PEP_ID=MMETSP0371-20130417/23873_1 /TAXON_ID=268820 /ORGANISM="Peridinium aciculiferum, Strain PAER-2" /LENGTH=493 /DNA_ID=CAMNT_0025729933 /DNA_START=15 /DNA_END=1496 /DNA_ORIENTATION=+
MEGQSLHTSFMLPTSQRASRSSVAVAMQDVAWPLCRSRLRTNTAELATATSAASSAVAATAVATAAVGCSVTLVAQGRLHRRRRGRRGARIVASAGETIELFKRFGPEDDPFEILTEEVLGVGGQGTVYRCARVKDPSQVFAAKAVPIWRLQNDPESSARLAVFEKEAEIIKRLQGHPNIAECLGCWDVGHPFGKDALPAMYKMMVVELVDGGSLASIIAKNGRLDERIARNVFRQTLGGLKFMHGCKILHRDLKCDNILVCSESLEVDSRIKLIDFGVARLISNSYAQSCVGTREIMAPEIVCAKLMVAPQGQACRRSGPLTFASPQERSPGFGLATARADGKGALVSGIEVGGQGEEKRVCDGWAIAKINEVDATDLPFLPDAQSPRDPSIVGLLQTLDSEFTVEFLELPQRRFTEAVDFWSLGVVLYTMLAGKVPFSSEQEIMLGTYPEDSIAHASESARDLIKRLLALDPVERATCTEVEAHLWLAEGA